MTSRRFLSASRLTAIIALVTMSLAPVAGQVPSVTTTPAQVTGSPWTAPRTLDGDPDLQGIWDYRTITPLERPSELAGKEYLTDEEAAAYERRMVERGDGRPPDDPRSDPSVHAVWWLDYGFISLDASLPLPTHVRSWLGHSRGRWEGESLIVETTGFTDKLEGILRGARAQEKVQSTKQK